MRNIGIVVSLAVISFFVANVPLSKNLSPISAGAVILFAWPAYFWVIQYVGWRRGCFLIGSLMVFALGIETLALHTGFPYGRFEYRDVIGTLLFGKTPWTVAFAWPPLVLGATAAATHLTKSRFRSIAIATLLLVAADVVIDPGSVSIGFWEYQNGGFFYNVPLSNFFGWILSGAVGTAFTAYLLRFRKPLPWPITRSLFFILIFWTSVCYFRQLWIPAFVGTAYVAFLAKSRTPDLIS